MFYTNQCYTTGSVSASSGASFKGNYIWGTSHPTNVGWSYKASVCYVTGYSMTGSNLNITYDVYQGVSKTNYSKGTTQYTDVTSTSSSAYPSNGASGSYWYVYKGVQ